MKRHVKKQLENWLLIFALIFVFAAATLLINDSISRRLQNKQEAPAVEPKR